MQTKENTIQDKFFRFLTEICQCEGSESFLLTVSGGMDSMVMLDLFRHQALKFSIAHCNFGLRGEESEADEDFVTKVALEFNIPIFTRKFDTLQVSCQKGISVQMAARDLRYQWFHELAQTEKFDLVATAHHSDDVVETFLINLSRGTGIAGLTGIKARSGKLVRPLLFLSKQAIAEYAGSRRLRWREDSSNRSEKYLRNRIRLRLIPEISKTFPGFSEAVLRTISQMQEAEQLLKNVAGNFTMHHTRKKGQRFEIDREGLRSLPQAEAVLFEVLRPFGFNYPAVVQLTRSLDRQPGKKFFSRTHRLTVDRTAIIIEPLAEEIKLDILVPETTAAMQHPLNLKFEEIKSDKGFLIPTESHIACLDRDVLKFPLKIRRWKKGDYFIPLGMKGRKKLSDYFVDKKISFPDKKKIWVMESGANIVWVIGRRIDDRYKVTPNTKDILQITFDSIADEES